MIKIRAAELNDAAQISELITPLAKHFICHEFSTSAQAAMLNSMSKQQIRENIEDNYKYYLAYKKEQLVGIIGILNGSHLFHLFVEENCHQQGIGKQLWQYALTQTKQKSMSVNASKFAYHFYRKLGFKPTEGKKEKNGISYYPMRYDRN
ncbi:GNAT family N-acetyltransferase [Aliikangiella sp. IMCC44359]|uniref:GNAT family N-acetyltransferase n=1 Tax=Aliikangiella sp. IMCC44359 TaxID=3459125 RepID=UPI00403AEF32